MNSTRITSALLALLLCADSARADTIVVNQQGISFVPADITISVGDTVQWVWTLLDHTVSEGDDLKELARIAFGAGTGTPARSVNSKISNDPAWYRRLETTLREWFPEFRDVGIDAVWGGPIDLGAHHVPFFGSMWGGNVHYGMGFTGGGVGPCVLAGQILSSLALGRQDEFSSLALVGLRSKRFPPEPLLSVGAKLTLAAILRTDDAWEAGRSGNPVLELMARLPRRFGYNLGH